MELRRFEKQLFLKKGNLRKLVYEHLTEPKTASELSKELKKHRSAISRVLLDMDEGGLAKCLNPKDKKFKHYVRLN